MAPHSNQGKSKRYVLEQADSKALPPRVLSSSQIELWMRSTHERRSFFLCLLQPPCMATVVQDKDTPFSKGVCHARRISKTQRTQQRRILEWVLRMTPSADLCRLIDPFSLVNLFDLRRLDTWTAHHQVLLELETRQYS